MGHFSSDPSCPAKGKKCNNCFDLGHFAAKCQKPKKRQSPEDLPHPPGKKVRLIQYDTSNEDKNEDKNENKDEVKRNYLFMVKRKSKAVLYGGEEETKVTVKVNNINVTAVIDSGCPVNIVNNNTYARLITSGLIEKDYQKGCDIPFYGYEVHRPAIEIKGSVAVQISFGERVISSRLYIAPYGRENLLGKQTAEALGLLQVGPRILEISTGKVFPKLKNCLINVTINRNITPTVVKYRRMPLQVEERVHAEVHKLLEAGIIEAVPTEEITWVSRMLAIPKDNGEYRLVVDMRMPNTAVRPEYYPQPSVEEALMLPPIAKMSKIDLKKGFHLCELHPKCRDITAFATKEGVFRYTRLMFGLKSAPELFNRELDKVFMNHKGLTKYCDDFLVYGSTQGEHDDNLAEVLKTIKDFDLEINEEKSVYNVQKVNFLGHVVTTKGTFPDPEKVRDIKKHFGLLRRKTNCNRFWVSCIEVS